MGKKLFFFAVLVAVFVACPASAVLQNIIWVSDNKNPENLDPTTGGPRDQVWVDLLQANGYAVDMSFANKEGRTLDDDKIAALNAADLIIISRNTDSGSYDDGDEVAQWNSVTTPILMQVMHISRSSRWKWLNTTNTNDTVQDMLAVLPDHPVFEGVALNEGNQVSAILSTTSLTTHTDPGNGTLIAQGVDDACVWIVEWAMGQEFYDGSGQIAGGPRMLLSSGGTTGNMDGLYNLTPEGERIFLNAVGYMIPEPATIALFGLGALALCRRRRS